MENEVNKNSAADLIMSFLLIISGGLIIFAALGMKVYKTFLDAPGFFPLILGVIFIVLGTFMLFSSIKRKGHEQVGAVFSKDSLKRFFTHDQFKRVMILIALMVIYIIVIMMNWKTRPGLWQILNRNYGKPLKISPKK